MNDISNPSTLPSISTPAEQIERVIDSALYNSEVNGGDCMCYAQVLADEAENLARRQPSTENNLAASKARQIATYGEAITAGFERIVEKLEACVALIPNPAVADLHAVLALQTGVAREIFCEALDCDLNIEGLSDTTMTAFTTWTHAASLELLLLRSENGLDAADIAAVTDQVAKLESELLDFEHDAKTLAETRSTVEDAFHDACTILHGLDGHGNVNDLSRGTLTA